MDKTKHRRKTREKQCCFVSIQALLQTKFNLPPAPQRKNLAYYAEFSYFF